ncbi:uncharacterized protein E6C27_scaffold128G00100 [Cucumis melo var. makuwa]|uniref:Uncharacterized protein n=1 Tax=Cucumis melo var. makuwa TaxID=1194695 RepID=A0A5A7THK5_CUCMM|nr:uncharacterized protein E6C27_scaffold128G00100 [Cucumis melo var. makuwa]
MLSSHLRWDLHLMFGVTVDALSAGVGGFTSITTKAISINTFHFWLVEESVILAMQADEVFYLEDRKNDEHMEVDTLCRLDIYLTMVERPIVHHVADFIIDDDEQLSHQTGSSYDKQ